MIICHCFYVSDREIRLAIAMGATDIDAIGDACGAGLGCGNCHDTLTAMLAEMTQQHSFTTREETRLSGAPRQQRFS